MSNNEELSSTASPSSSPLVVFAHHAGAPSSSDWMIRIYPPFKFSMKISLEVQKMTVMGTKNIWKEMLKEALGAVQVVTFDYPFIAGGKRKAPPKAEKLVDHHSDVVKDATAVKAIAEFVSRSIK